MAGKYRFNTTKERVAMKRKAMIYDAVLLGLEVMVGMFTMMCLAGWAGPMG